MRLVDREQRDAAAVEQVDGRRDAKAFGGEIQQVQLAREVGRLDPSPFVWPLSRVEESGSRAYCGEGIHLICIRAMSGEITTPVPSRTSAGIW